MIQVKLLAPDLRHKSHTSETFSANTACQRKAQTHEEEEEEEEEEGEGEGEGEEEEE